MRNTIFIAALLAIAWWLTPPVDQITGRARVVDGDTFWLGQTKIRVFGIDAPEAATPMGPVATKWLRDRIEGQEVACIEKDVDRYGRIVATCTHNGEDIAAQITQAGLAEAYRRYSLDYADEEQSARRAEIGIWAASSTSTQVRDCPIKGNISSGGKYYHQPGSKVYANVRIDTSKGERWFCTEAEARNAGWRPVP